MQNRYVGDIGDFAKYSLINALSVGKRLGVAWYLYPDESHNADGKHTAYLSKPAEWRNKDPLVFDGLKRLLETNNRSTDVVIANSIFKTEQVASELLNHESTSHFAREAWRKTWFKRTLDSLVSCNMVFADPDNGLCLDENFKTCNKKQWKRLPLSEANALSKGRTAVFYHHNSRRKGGHDKENAYWLGQLDGAKFAIKYNAFSSRTFFVVNPSEEMERNAQKWCSRFGHQARFYQAE